MAYYIDDTKIINDSAEVTAPISPSYQYKTITIGTQTWMAENLKETRFRDGTPIPNITDGTDWGSASAVGAYCMYQDITYLSPLYGEFYGYLYNWEAAANGTVDCSDTDYGGLAPDGWHVPTNDEWEIMQDYLDNPSDDGSMCADRKDLWTATNTTLIDSSEFGTSGFNALPAGYRDNGSGGSYGGMGGNCYIWSSSEHNSTHAYAWGMHKSYAGLYSGGALPKNRGFNVRCIKDV